MKKLFTLSVACLAMTIAANAQLIKNDFLTGYAAGETLEKGAYDSTTQGEDNPIKLNQWNLSGKTGDNDQSPESASPKTVAALTYTGYGESGKDVAIDLLKLEKGGRTTIYSLSNDAETYGAGTYYVAFMANVSAATTSAAEFLSLDGNYTGNAQRARYTVKGIDENTYEVGLGDGKAATDFINKSFNFNQTYLAVIKVVIDGEGTGNAYLYVNPDMDAEPATADATTEITGTALKSIRGLVIRQRSTLAAHVGGFRFAKSWADAIGATVDGIDTINSTEVSVYANGKTLITNQAGTIKVYNLTGAEVANQVINGSLETTLNNGVYVAEFTNEAGKTTVTKVVIR